MNYNVRINVSLRYFDPTPNKNNNNSPFSSIIVFIFKNVKDLVVTMVFCTQELKVDSKTLIYQYTQSTFTITYYSTYYSIDFHLFDPIYYVRDLRLPFTFKIDT